MSEQELKLIENHIKDLLFNKNPSTAAPVQNNPDSKYNMGPFSFSQKLCLSNQVDSQRNENLPSSMPVDSSYQQPSSSSSQLIDVHVLTNFAAKHADMNEISNSPRVLPHPELENDHLTSPGTSISKELLFSSNAAQEPKITSKFSHLPNNFVEENYGKKSSIQSEHPDHNEQVLSVKNKKSRRRKPVANRKMPLMTESPVNQSTSSPKKGSPKREIINAANKYHSSQKEEIKKDILNNRNFEANQQSRHLSKSEKIPPISEEVVYTLTLTKEGYKFVCNICNYEAKSRDYIHKHINSENHKELKKQILSDRVLPFLPQPLPGQIESINEFLMKCHVEHGLQDEDSILRQKIADRLIEFTEQHLPGCSVDMIGSSVTLMGLKKSKVDFILKVDQEQSIPDSLELLYEKLQLDSSYCDVESAFKEKRLGILFTDKETKLECNIILENAFSEKYAKLFAMYSELDPRVRILASCFRYWAKLCLLDNLDHGTLPSFTFPILLVYFLQQTEPPVLPVLHEIKEYGNNNFADKYIKEKVWKSENKCSVGELWIKLFYFYNFDYELGKHVVCVRSSDKVMCSERNWATKFYAIEVCSPPSSPLPIRQKGKKKEDKFTRKLTRMILNPFSRRNIAHVIPNFQVCQYLQQCFLRTYRYFAFPQTKNGNINLLRTEEFELLLLSHVSAKSEARDLSDDESLLSDNEDSSIADESSFLQDFEDQDPDLPIENVLSTLKDMSIDENKNLPDEGVIDDALDQAITSLHEISEPAHSPKKEAKINREKILKIEERQRIQAACSWDIGNQRITKELFEYKMDSSKFKSKKEVPYNCKQCKASGHLKKNCPNDELPVPKELPEMTPEFSRLINKILYYIRDRNCVDDGDKDFMMNHMKDIEYHIKKLFPEARLSMFGSFCNGFGFKNRSDMDFCLTFKDQEDSKNLDSTGVIENLAKQLLKFPKLENIVPVTSAKVPIVKFTCTQSGLEGDISLYNTLALANTEMLEMYSKIDDRVQVLGFALKYFAKVLGICDASRGSLSSYAYILMALFFLQQRQPPVIPVLQELHDGKKPICMVDEWNVWYFKDLDKLPEVWPDYGKNKETVAELWQGLLSFYAYDFDWREYVVSIKQKAPLTRFRKLWITDQIAIEDPFDLSHNLGAGLSRKMNMYILRTFVRARERFGTPLSMEDYARIQGHEVNYLFDRRFLNSGSDPPHDRGCRKCGKIGHLAKNCSQEKLCSYCKKPGHIAKNCPVKKPKNKAKHNEKNTQEMYAESRNNKDVQNHQGPPMRIQSNDIQRTNNSAFNMPSKNSDDRDPTRKFLQMGFPMHRHPPPGFPTSFPTPPPGFKSMHQNNAKYNPRFSTPSPAPFPRAMPMNNLSHSPPKHYSNSPPKNCMGSNMSMPLMGLRPNMPPPPIDPMLHRMWHTQPPPNRMAQQYTDRRKRTN